MRKMTEENLRAALAGESEAHIRYSAFAGRAEREGHANVARLFRAIAYAEEVHATNHLAELRRIRSTLDNLDAAIEGEAFEIEEMYPAYLAVAGLQGEQGARRTIHYALEAAKTHVELYVKSRDAIAAGEDPQMAEIRVCPVCGYTVVGAAPDHCPVCSTEGKLFRLF